MLSSVQKSTKGYVKLRVQGDSSERFLNLCTFHQMDIWGIVFTKNTYEMYISLQDFYRIKPLLRKTNTHISILEKRGVPFWLARNQKRKIYYLSICICIVLLVVLSNFVWDINFTGNLTETNEMLLEYLYANGIKAGMKKSDLDCEELAKDIRNAFDDIVWVSAAINGSRLTVHVKENDDQMQEIMAEELDETPKDLIAQKDAVINSIITRTGIPAVHEGDTVQKGDLLVSGRIEVLNDAGEIIDYQYQRSDAEITGLTTLDYLDILPLTYEKKQYEEKEQHTFVIQLFQYQLEFGNGFIIKETELCEDLFWRKQVKFGESMQLPLYYGYKNTKNYVLSDATYSQEEAQTILSSNFSLFCEELAKKGVQITENNVKILIDQNQAAATGSLSLVEPLGEPVDTEILTIERNENDESFGNNY